MGAKIPEFDVYIAKSAPFARTILKRLRSVVHAACPAVEETIKWGHPHFTYHGLFCGMAAFKKHCTFGFWHPEMQKSLKSRAKADEAWGQLGCLATVDDLPDKAAFTRLVKQAMKLNETKSQAPRKRAAKKRPPPEIPPDFLAALARNKKAHASFAAFSPSHQREYVEWIVEAKRDETRQKRLKAALEWLAEGKSRHWKHQ